MVEGRQEITLDTIDEHRRQLRALAIRESVALHRDKVHAHFDKEYFVDRTRLYQEAPIFWRDLGDAKKAMGAVVNGYSADFDGDLMAWEPIGADLGYLLSMVRKGIVFEKMERER